MLLRTASVFLAAAFLSIALGSAGPAAGQQAKPISVIAFPGETNWPIWVAQEKGYFASNNLAVTLTATPDSKFQLTGLIDGRFDIAMTGIDNVVAYVEGQGEAPTNEPPDIFAFMGGGGRGLLRLLTVPEVTSYADLKGKQVSVDAMTTGYAFVLRKLLEKGGLAFSDVEFVSAGGAHQRFQALMQKKHAGTLLISPAHAAAEARGFNRLANAEDVIGRYQGPVAAARRNWAKENRAELVGYIRAHLAALEWLYDPANKIEAIAILRRNLPSLSEALAASAYEIVLHSENGISRRADIDPEGVRTVLALRSEYGNPRKELTNIGKYYDLQYYGNALGK